MKPFNYRTSYAVRILIAFTLTLSASCELDDMPDPNNPSLEGVQQNASVPVLNTIVTGTESGMRANLEFYLDNVGAVGRDILRFSTADPRYTSDLLGKGSATLDNNAFYSTNPWNAFYRTIKNCNTLIAAVNNSDQPSEEQKQGYLAFANTIKAYSFLLALNLTNDNGIRIEVADPDNLGPIVDKTASLTAIAALLEEANSQLNSAGSAFAFQLSEGFSGFNTPETFKQFNQALAARVAVYRGNYAEALTHLDQSFLTLTGNYNAIKDIGAYHIFSNAGGDQLNRFFFAVNATGEVRGAHPSYLADAVAAGEQNDLRISGKITARDNTASLDNLAATHSLAVYKTNLDPIAIIRNEELMLIYAEASIRTGAFPAAVGVLNTIRVGNGLSPYTGAQSEAALTDEMLKQRRYSLFGEGHRWIDMRRYNRLGQLPIDRPDDNVWNCFPIPFPENEASACQ